jgi:cyclic pyranopterin phosphate synthase
MRGSVNRGKRDDMNEKRSPHLDEEGRLSMVDVGEKPATQRAAVARARLRAEDATLDAIWAGDLEKGEALACARIAGIQAAKKTGDLIPLCHPLALTHVEIRFTRGEGSLEIEAESRCTGPTGVEMEAMTAAAVAALTIYDMAKGIERGMSIEAVELLEKRGGRSGHWQRDK